MFIVYQILVIYFERLKENIQNYLLFQKNVVEIKTKTPWAY